MIKQALVLCTIVSSLGVFGQSVVSTQGETYETTSGSISFTVGEAVIATETDGTTTLTQGFHQTKWNLVGILDYNNDFYAEVYPNPSSDILQIKVKNFENISYELFDAIGKLAASGRLANENTQIQVAHLASGSYHLRLSDEKNIPLKNFKLIKQD